MDLGDYWQNFFPNSEYGHTGEIVKRAFQDNYKKSIKLSGSQVTGYIVKIPMKQQLRNE